MTKATVIAAEKSRWLREVHHHLQEVGDFLHVRWYPSYSYTAAGLATHLVSLGAKGERLLQQYRMALPGHPGPLSDIQVGLVFLEAFSALLLRRTAPYLTDEESLESYTCSVPGQCKPTGLTARRRYHRFADLLQAAIAPRLEEQ